MTYRHDTICGMATRPTEPTLQRHHGADLSWTSFWRDETGRKRTKRFGKASEINARQAKARYTRWLADWLHKSHVQNPGSEPAQFSASQLATLYKDHAERTFTKGGQITSHVWQVRLAMDAMSTAWGNRPIVQIESHELASLRDAMIHTADGKPLSISTVNGRLAIIKEAMRWAAGEQGLLPDAKAMAFRLVRPLAIGRSEALDPVKVRPIHRSVVEATIEACPQVLRDMITVQGLTGMRPGEVCNLRTCDIDRSGECWIYTPQTHKMQHKGIERHIAIGPKAQAILQKYMQRDLQAYLFTPEEAQEQRLEMRHAARRIKSTYGNTRGTNRTSTPHRKPGTRYDEKAYRRAIHYACRKAGIDAWNPNQLRHTWATEVRRAMGLAAASAGLGHNDLETTLIYAEQSIETAKDVAMKVG